MALVSVVAANSYGYNKKSNNNYKHQESSSYAAAGGHGKSTYGHAGAAKYGQSSYGHGGYTTDYAVSLYIHHLNS